MKKQYLAIDINEVENGFTIWAQCKELEDSYLNFVAKDATELASLVRHIVAEVNYAREIKKPIK